MTFEDMDFDNDIDVNDTPPPKESSNRTFLMVGGVLGVIIVVTIICMAIYALVIAPQRSNAEATKVSEINSQNTAVAMAAEQTSEAAKFTATSTQTRIPDTPAPSPTLVVAVPTEVAASPTSNSRTATVAALLTQAAVDQLTTTATPTASELPDTGFAEDLGVPGLVGLTLVLVVVIFLARRLRASTA